MKEKEFINNLEKLYMKEGINIPVYYIVDKKDNILLDFGSMLEEFDNKIKAIQKLLK